MRTIFPSVQIAKKGVRSFHEKFKLRKKDLLLPFGYVNNKLVKKSSSGSSFDVVDPGSGALVAVLPNLGVKETKLAIESASRAFDSYSKTTAKTRSALLRKLYNLLLENKQDLAAIITAECGKPIGESLGEVEYGASFIEWFADVARHTYGSIVPSPFANKRFLVQKEPIGVAAIITPWNFPNAMITRKIGAALAAGCTTVIKPAAEAPLSAVALAKLVADAGFPAGAVNVITCSKEDSPTVGSELCSNVAVKKLSFTGSTNVGKLLMKQCAQTVKRVSLELGGNAPFIVFDDADIDAAIQGCIASKFRNTGQTCVCVNRIFVQDGVYEKFTEKLAEALTSMRQGHGLYSEHALGPVISRDAVEKVTRHVSDAVSKGAKVFFRGETTSSNGHYYPATVLTNVPYSSVIAREETFGPVAAVFRFKTEQQVVELANDTPFGLAAYFYTEDVARIVRVSEGLKAGMVGVNEGIISSAEAPFGGVKESGIGREGSISGIDEYLNVKYICLGNLK